MLGISKNIGSVSELAKTSSGPRINHDSVCETQQPQLLIGSLESETAHLQKLLLTQANSFPCAINNKFTKVTGCDIIDTLEKSAHLSLYLRFSVCHSFLPSIPQPAFYYLAVQVL